MVLENILPSNWSQRKFFYAFLLSIVYTIVSVVLAALIFGNNSGLASVIFLSLFLIPTLRKLFNKIQKQEEHEVTFNLVKLYKHNKELIHIYASIFVGVYLTYYIITFFGMYLGFSMSGLFKEQLLLDPLIRGLATYKSGLFWNILQNNWWVLVVCFFLSLISGDGAIFFIVWNASSWAVIFGTRTIAASSFLGDSPLIVGFALTLIVLPHIILEATGYIFAAIAGSVISRNVLAKSKDLTKFLMYLVGTIMVYFATNMFIRLAVHGRYVIILLMIVFLGLFYLLKNSFSDPHKKRVFVYNYWLFVIALVIFLVGVFVETAILSYSGLLATYYDASMKFFL